MLDIRIPIGLMFSILGVILAVFGLVSGPEIYKLHSLGVNVNLGWGCMLLAFGLFMLTLAYVARQRSRNGGDSP
jgi:hypothetical protein